MGVTDEVTRRSGEVSGVATVGQSGQGGERREKGSRGGGVYGESRERQTVVTTFAIAIPWSRGTVETREMSLRGR